ncbi:MAG: signal protein PDZ [Anaerolineales bacterium]|nr:PDZ domain-containing protein [Anaerolineae bacterium]PWB55665.1 MAG: signal protein PDZ [Anaerolineales bacterium]
MASDTGTLNTLSDALVKAVEKAGEATVLVNARRRMPASGIVYAHDLIITADHVVERDEDISVRLADGREINASIAGRDPGNDLALIRLAEAAASPAEKVNQDTRIGQLVIALGRPSEEGIEASLGIISAIGGPVRTGRGGMLERYLRTDAVPFPGFSGGPLVDTEGRVVGLNTSGLAHGVAITIPAFLVWSDAENLAKFGYIKRGYLGIRSQQVELAPELSKALGREQATGLLLVTVERESPAETGGLIVGDILVAIEGQATPDHDALMVHLSGDKVGKSLSLQIMRGGQPKTISVVIGERK